MAAVLHEMQRQAQLDMRKLLSKEKVSQPDLSSNLTCSQVSDYSSPSSDATLAEILCLTGKHLIAFSSPILHL